jgi:hypothetical protein
MPTGHPSVDQLMAGQGTGPITDVAVLHGDFWPEEESIEDFLERGQRSGTLQSIRRPSRRSGFGWGHVFQRGDADVTGRRPFSKGLGTI